MIRKAIALLLGVVFPVLLAGQTNLPPEKAQVTWGIDVFRPILFGGMMIAGQNPVMGMQVHRFRSSVIKPKLTYRSTFGFRYFSGSLSNLKWYFLDFPTYPKEDFKSYQYYEIRYALGKSWNLFEEKRFQLYAGFDFPLSLGYELNTDNVFRKNVTTKAYTGQLGIIPHFGILIRSDKWPKTIRFELGSGLATGLEFSRSNDPLLTDRQKKNLGFVLNAPINISGILVL